MTAISKLIEAHRPAFEPYEQLYKELHADPELSFCESETAKTIHKHLSRHAPNGYHVQPDIGGHGLAATLENGNGPTILLRADTDALPVLEKTGLPYASTKRMKDHEGIEQPVMHACGHDMHITALLAAAELLFAARKEWAGTLVLIFQPAEEKGAGAQAMVDDGLYTRHAVPVPDVAIGAHVMPYRAGVIGTRVEVVASSADTYKVTLHGRGGHASQPHVTCDPVVMAAYATTRLQTLVGREINPLHPAVVTVASIQAGQAENIIAQSAVMKIDLRSSAEDVRKKLNDGVKRIIKAESMASNAPQEPDFEIIRTFPIAFNTIKETEMLHKTMQEHFGESYDDRLGPLGGSEDFPILGTSVEKPCVFWMYGGTDRDYYDTMKDEGRLSDMPINHSAYYAPVIQPTLQTGIDGYSVSALTWLIKS